MEEPADLPAEPSADPGGHLNEGNGSDTNGRGDDVGLAGRVAPVMPRAGRRAEEHTEDYAGEPTYRSRTTVSQSKCPCGSLGRWVLGSLGHADFRPIHPTT